MLLCNDNCAGNGPKYAASNVDLDRLPPAGGRSTQGYRTMLARGRLSFALTGFVVAALATLAPVAAKADALADIIKNKVIKVAVPQDVAPFGSAGTDLKPQGYDIDMANLIATALGVKAEIIAVTSANRVPYLQTKKADLVISSLGKNPDREKVIDFSAAYAPFFSGVFGTKDIKVAA